MPRRRDPHDDPPPVRVESVRPKKPRYDYPPVLPADRPFPAAPLDVALADLAAWWIEARCGRTVAYLPCRLLAAEHGWRTPLRLVVGRLRCQRCGERPAGLALTDQTSPVPMSVTVARRVPI